MTVLKTTVSIDVTKVIVPIILKYVRIMVCFVMVHMHSIKTVIASNRHLLARMITTNVMDKSIVWNFPIEKLVIPVILLADVWKKTIFSATEILIAMKTINAKLLEIPVDLWNFAMKSMTGVSIY